MSGGLCDADAHEGRALQGHWGERTGPIRSGTNQAHKPTLPRMKKKPIKVTMFGASHTGSRLAAQFHCCPADMLLAGRTSRALRGAGFRAVGGEGSRSEAQV